jgi:hypothetical protein
VASLADKKLLTLGVQDCFFSYDGLVEFLRRHRIPHRTIPHNEIRLTTGFKWWPSEEAATFTEFIHQSTLFNVLGFAPNNIRSMDISDYEGADIVHDLNVPVDESMYSKFDVIFDGGTTEHIFSIKDTLFNVARMCQQGGLVIHNAPVDYINHGFVNLGAEIYRDFPFFSEPLLHGWGLLRIRENPRNPSFRSCSRLLQEVFCRLFRGLCSCS